VPGNHIWSLQFDAEFCVELEKRAQDVLLVPPSSLAQPVCGIFEAIKNVMKVDRTAISATRDQSDGQYCQ
jgi:hypothetical protein